MVLEPPIHDLAIGRRLADGMASEADLVEVAAWPLVRRAVWLGGLLARGALLALRGVRGVAGVRSLVGALDDTRTRDAARHALMHTAHDAPYRWAHALFHSDPEVR